MSDTFHEQSFKKSRKVRMCHWCGADIEIGQPYQSYGWRDCGDSGYCYMHPECMSACNDKGNRKGVFQFMIGDYNRGCCCQHNQCECGGLTGTPLGVTT